MPYFIKKPIPVLAEQQDAPFTVETLEGTVTGKAGDYLVTGPAGEQWPVNREIFEHTYYEVEKHVFDVYHAKRDDEVS